jgi:hypothetical protein
MALSNRLPVSPQLAPQIRDRSGNLHRAKARRDYPRLADGYEGGGGGAAALPAVDGAGASTCSTGDETEGDGGGAGGSNADPSHGMANGGACGVLAAGAADRGDRLLDSLGMGGGGNGDLGAVDFDDLAMPYSSLLDGLGEDD